MSPQCAGEATSLCPPTFHSYSALFREEFQAVYNICVVHLRKKWELGIWRKGKRTKSGSPSWWGWWSRPSVRAPAVRRPVWGTRCHGRDLIEDVPKGKVVGHFLPFLILFVLWGLRLHHAIMATYLQGWFWRSLTVFFHVRAVPRATQWTFWRKHPKLQYRIATLHYDLM